MSCSTLVRSDWMPCVVVFSCCASVCAADSADRSAPMAARAVRQRLQRRGEIVERVFQRAVAAGRAVDALQLAQDVGDLVGIAAARGFGAQLALHEQIELAVDAGDRDRRAGAAARDLDLVGRSG